MKNNLIRLSVVVLFTVLYSGCSKESETLSPQKEHIAPPPRNPSGLRTTASGITYSFNEYGYVYVAGPSYTKQVTVTVQNTSKLNRGVSVVISALPSNTCFQIASVNSGSGYEIVNSTKINWSPQSNREGSLGPGRSASLTYTIRAQNPTSCVESAWSLTVNGQATNYTDDYAYYITTM